MTEQERYQYNLRYVLRMLKNPLFTREEIIHELEFELESSQRSTLWLWDDHNKKQPAE